MEEFWGICIIALLVFGTVLAVLIAAQDPLPKVPQALCPHCSGRVKARIKTCDVLLATVLFLLLSPLVAIIYVLVTRGKYRLYCPVCKSYLGNHVAQLELVSETESELEVCTNCRRPIGKLETPHLWKEAVVCTECSSRLRAQVTPASRVSSGPMKSFEGGGF